MLQTLINVSFVQKCIFIIDFILSIIHLIQNKWLFLYQEHQGVNISYSNVF